MEKVAETRMIYAHLATLGLTLLGVYSFAPFFLDEGLLPGWEEGAMHTGQFLSKIPWVKVAAVGSIIPYAVAVSRFIPKKVKKRASGAVFVEDTDRSDILETHSVVGSPPRLTAYEGGRNHRKRKVRGTKKHAVLPLQPTETE